MKTLVKKSVRDLRAYVPGEQPLASGIVKLNTNESPYPPSPRVRAALAGLDYARLRLYPDPRNTALRAAIATLHGCAPRQVFAGNGSDEILALCTRAFVEDDGVIGFFEPSYSLYPVLARIRDVAAAPVELGRDFEWQMPAKFKASLFFMTNPNAPTGVLYPQAAVRAFCRRFQGVVVLDEAYVDFARADCLGLALECDNVLALRTLSKSYSLAGLRLGYAVGAVPLIEALFKIKDSYNLDRVTQALALAALKDQGYLRANVERIRRTRGRLAAALEKTGFKVTPSETNFLWVRPPRLAANTVFRRLRANNILVRHFPGRRTGAYLRITVGDDRQVDALLDALRRIFG